MPSRTSHISQLPGQPVGSVARPVATGSACLIYCVSVPTMDVNLGSSTTHVAFAELPFTLTERSTVNIQIIWALSGASYYNVWDFQPFFGSVHKPVSEVGDLRAVTTAATRDAGNYVVSASCNDSGSGATGTIMIVVIVGSNTEDDCLEYAAIF